jgi:HAD superfamily phosphatase
MIKPLLVFDMDGVLVDVTDSYRETIAQTVEHFTGVRIGNDRIQQSKNDGGWSDDWKLSHHLVKEAGVDVPFEAVQARFQELFLGNGDGGLMRREKWVARPGVLEKLYERFRFAVFTGRPREEARMTLDRFAPDLIFDPIVAMHDVENHKPAPDGLLKILQHHGASPASGPRPPAPVYYVGDTVDDARSARGAGVPFIGIAAPSNPLYLDLVFLFQEEGAFAIIDDINYLDEVFQG